MFPNIKKSLQDYRNEINVIKQRSSIVSDHMLYSLSLDGTDFESEVGNALECMKVSGRSGRIELILGPMYSGKSSEMLSRVKTHSYSRKTCVIVKYEHDTRYSTKFSTHDEITCDAIPSSKNLMSVIKKCVIHDVVAVDEGQFYDDLVLFCETLANLGIIVIVSALDGDFKRENFGQVHELIPKCESIIKKTASCECGDEAVFTHRMVDSADVELIGGMDKYESLCRLCFNLKNSH